MAHLVVANLVVANLVLANLVVVRPIWPRTRLTHVVAPNPTMEGLSPNPKCFLSSSREEFRVKLPEPPRNLQSPQNRHPKLLLRRLRELDQNQYQNCQTVVVLWLWGQVRLLIRTN